MTTVAAARKKGAVKRRKKASASAVVKRLSVLIIVLVLLITAAYFVNIYVEKNRHKLVYPNEIRASADEFSLDPYLVAAVINCESGNRASVVSPKGATGLMQIMPETGAWIAEKLEYADYCEADLCVPCENIRMGCWYLRFLSDKYGGNINTALAAYNAGPGNVDKWLDDPVYSAGGVLTNIPFPETKAYVERVTLAKQKYEELYEKELG